MNYYIYENFKKYNDFTVFISTELNMKLKGYNTAIQQIY